MKEKDDQLIIETYAVPCMVIVATDVGITGMKGVDVTNLNLTCDVQ